MQLGVLGTHFAEYIFRSAGDLQPDGAACQVIPIPELIGPDIGADGCHFSVFLDQQVGGAEDFRFGAHLAF